MRRTETCKAVHSIHCMPLMARLCFYSFSVNFLLSSFFLLTAVNSTSSQYMLPPFQTRGEVGSAQFLLQNPVCSEQAFDVQKLLSSTSRLKKKYVTV